MPNTLNSDLFFIILALIVSAILGFLIAWFMKSIKMKALKKSLNACYKENEGLKKNNQTNSITKPDSKTIQPLKKSLPKNNESNISENKELKIASTYSAKSPDPSSNLYDKEAAKKAMGKTIKENDLKLVEGIGPKIAELLNQDGITTWLKLGNTPVSKVQKILTEAGDRFSFHKPDTWPRQSLLAAEGKWEELKKLQNYLDGGKEPS